MNFWQYALFVLVTILLSIYLIVELVLYFAKLFPQYEFVPEFSWSGTFGSTKDGLPYIGKYKNKPQGLFALGFGGNGITFSTIAAEMLRDEILEKDNQDIKIFAFDR